MFGPSSPGRIVASLTVLTLSLLTAVVVNAQTPTAAVDKPVAEISTSAVKSAANVTAPASADAARSANASLKAEAESVKTETPPDTPPTAAAPATAPVTTTTPATVVAPATPAAPMAQCTRTVKADIVAIPKALMLNRLGATIPNAFVFALRSDTIGTGNNIQLRPGKRPRPLVLRANVGDCLQVTFTNAIPPAAFNASTPNNPKVATQEVSLHIQGQEWTTGPSDDGSFVGTNDSSLASATPAPSPMPPPQQVYTLFVKNEGTYLLYTMGDTTAQPLGQLSRGLFGALNVQPAKAEWYRSQVTQQDLALATKKDASNKPMRTADGQPVIDYNAVYPAGSSYPDGTPIPANTPILKMLMTMPDGSLNIVHSDLTAIITGPNAGRFEGSTGANNPEPPCNAANNGSGAGDPLFCANPSSPDRKEPYREFTIIYHEVGQIATQAFPVFTDPQMASTINAGFDGFAINYGTGGIGAEVYANRIGVGPMGGCVDCKFEEFFLSAWSVGDPAMLVDRPANSSLLPAFTTSPAQPPIPSNPPPPVLCTAAQLGDTGAPPDPNCANARQPVTGAVNGFPYKLPGLVKATKAYYPDDPSNVYHSYINDHTKFRIHHGGTVATHVHHQHAHQWLMSPNSDQGAYLDSQMISPGASYTLEMTFNGSGNRNKVVGDSIFHCHFYPHFAAGMWALWRTHDVFESGTFVFPTGGAKSGQVVPGSRALPDGEIVGGTPTPAIVPLPTLPMAPLPAYAQIQHNVKVNGAQVTVGGQVVVGGTCQGNKINGLDVIGGCTNGQVLNGTVINSQFDGTNMTGQFQPSPGNQILNPGFPYFIPGIAGGRGPHPPLDFAPDGSGGFMDGGLPRHVVTGGSIAVESHDQFDWSKDLATMNAVQLPEDGTAVEKAAMAFFGKRCYATFLPDGTPGSCPSSNSTPPQSTLNNPPTGFVLNGLPRKTPQNPLGAQPGAPFADPAIDDNGNAVGLLRTYKAAAIQLNVTFNKKGWHFPQQRMLALWQDVIPTFSFNPGNPSSGRRPEPLFFRGNSGDIIEYWHTNLVPNYYLVDDFQVRTPTDILGQHIHLVKFDVTSSDGAGNGFNYEDGTFSPEEVQEMIKAINAAGGLIVNGTPKILPGPKTPPKDIYDCSLPANKNTLRCLPCPEHPTPDYPQCLSWLGAQTTIQRWYLDPLVDDSGVDRTLRTVFTHDHFGPSTHQQAGLYAGLLVEPVGSSWRNSEDGSPMGRPATQPPIRPDGGPTSWKADILTKDKNNNDLSYREFMLEFQDLQLAYATASTGTTAPPITKPSANPKKGWIDPAYAINAPSQSPTTATPNLISTGMDAAPPGTMSVNYTNEPLGYRVGQFADLSYAYDNSIQKTVNPLDPADPVTPLMRAYQNDNVQVRILVGAHVFAHQFNLEGPRWFAEPSWGNSGYRSVQAMGLSEHFELLFKVPSSSAPSTGRKCPDGMSDANCADYLYSPSLDDTGLANGMWGLFRAYDPTKVATKLQPLPNNAIGPSANVSYSTCPATLTPPAKTRTFNITAVTSQKALANQNPFPGTLVFNDRDKPSPGNPTGNPLYNALGVMYVRTEDLDPATGALKAGVPVEPLVLRANAGDCIVVNLTNGIAANSTVFTQPFTWAAPFNAIPVQNKMSMNVGLHPQLLSYDGAQSNGINVGWNSQGQKDQVVAYGKTITYQWYAGRIDRGAGGALLYTPVEFGSLNLFPSDPLFQHINGLFGSMIIEPAGSTWKCGEATGLADCDPSGGAPPTSRASATVTTASGGKFREFALMISDDIRISPNPDGSTNSGAVNYRTEPWKFRYTGNATNDFSCFMSNQLIQSPPQDPKTPIFTAAVGDSVRFRLTHPFGTGTSQVFLINGHSWQRNPYTSDPMPAFGSTRLGNNIFSQWLGSRDNHGATDHADILLDKAGGEAGRPGDYLYGVFVQNQVNQGSWGVFRVGNVPMPTPPVPAACTPVARPGYVPPSTREEKDVQRFIRKPLNPGSKP